jgi:two-component system chemotaxis response regulator CheB
MPASPAVVLVAASAGGISALSTILGRLPDDFSAPIVVVQHRGHQGDSQLVPILARQTRLPVKQAAAGETLKPGTVYVARADKHLTVTRTGRFRYSDGHRIRHVLSSANPLFASAATKFGAGAIGLVLTGTDSDATDGVQAVRERGGVVIAQDRKTSEFFDMPRSAIATGAVDYVLPLEDIAPAVDRLVRGMKAEGGRVHDQSA